MKCTEYVGTYGTQAMSSTKSSLINPCTSTIQPIQPSNLCWSNADDCFLTVQSAPGISDNDDQVMKDELTEMFPNINMQVIEEAVHDSVVEKNA